MSSSQHNDGLSGGPPRIFTAVDLGSGVLVVGSCTRGMSRSTDGGASWERVDALKHMSINTLAVDSDGLLVAATSGGRASSNDAGLTWSLDDSNPLYAVLPGAPDGPPGVVVFRLFRLHDGRVLAGTDGEGVWIHDRNGWRPAGLDSTIVYALAEAPDGTWLAGTRGAGVQRSTDEGLTWSASESGLPDVYVHCLLVLPDGEVLAGTGYGIVASTDAGRTWIRRAAPLAEHRIFSLAPLTDGSILVGTYDRMWIGDGANYAEVDPGLTPDEAWSVHATRDGTLYAGAKIGLIASSDHGETWSRQGSPSLALGFCETADGRLLVAGDLGVLAAPDWQSVGGLPHRARPLLEVEPGVLLAGTLGDGFHTFRDGSWSPVAKGPSHPLIYDARRSVSSNRLVAATAAIVDGVKDGGIFTSDDDGQTWDLRFEGRGMYNVTQMSDGMLFVGGQRCHIYSSSDDGESWSLLPLPVQAEAKLYSLFADGSDRILLGAGTQLLRSSDGGQSWEVLDNGMEGVSIYSLARGPDGLLAAATSSGVFVSLDGGESWASGELSA